MIQSRPEAKLADRRSTRGLVLALAADRRIRYLLAGGISSVTYYTAFSAGWLFWSSQIPYLLLAVLANLFTAALTYPLYRRLVFQYAGPLLAGFVRFYAVCLWSLAFSLLGLPLLVEVAHLHVLLAQAIIIVVSPLINYQLVKLWAFRERRTARPEPGDARR